MQRYAKNPRAVQVSLKICNDFEDCNLYFRRCDALNFIPTETENMWKI